MNIAPSRTASEPLKSNLMVYFLVGRFIPFVLYINSIFIPFICRNIPNSNYQTITKRVNGFTLIELVVTMAVAAILVAVAVPNMRTFIQNGRQATQINLLTGDLGYAFDKSITHSEPDNRPFNIGMCISTNGISCTGGGAWRDGYLIFIDANDDRVLNAGEAVLRFREALTGNDTLTATAILDPLIFTKGPANPALGAANFTFCDSRGPTSGRRINLNSQGRPTVMTGPSGAC